MYTINGNENIDNNFSLNCKNMIIKISWTSSQSDDIIQSTVDSIVNKISTMSNEDNTKESLSVVFTKDKKRIIIFNFFKYSYVIKRKRFLQRHFYDIDFEYSVDDVCTGNVLEVLQELIVHLDNNWEVHSVPKFFKSSSNSTYCLIIAACLTTF